LTAALGSPSPVGHYLRCIGRHGVLTPEIDLGEQPRSDALGAPAEGCAAVVAVGCAGPHPVKFGLGWPAAALAAAAPQTCCVASNPPGRPVPDRMFDA
jgi:hypothetical protein